MVSALSCRDLKGPKGSGETEVVKIQDVTSESTLEEVPLGFDRSGVLGVMDVKVWKDYLLISSQSPEGNFSVFNKRDGRFLGSFIRRGNGASEILFPMFFSSVVFDDGGASFLDSKGGLISWDIASSCQRGELVCSTERIEAEKHSRMTGFVVIDDETVLCKEITAAIDGYSRYLLKGGEKVVLPAQEALNSQKLATGDDDRINILSSSVVYDKGRRTVVEAPITLNEIRIYDIDGHEDKIVSVGKSDKIKDLELLPFERIPVTFKSPRTYESCFGVLFFDTTALDFEVDKTKNPLLLLFDWDGALVASYAFPVWVSTFDIDFDSGVVYAADYDEDLIYKFRIPNPAS